LIKPTFHRQKFTLDQLNQFELFFASKEFVNMSSFKTETSMGLPILYLQQQKTAL